MEERKGENRERCKVEREKRKGLLEEWKEGSGKNEGSIMRGERMEGRKGGRMTETKKQNERKNGG